MRIEPAFPFMGRNNGETLQFVGLTKRELFAAMAFQGMLAADGTTDWDPENAANYAVKCADALLAELAKVKT